MKEKGFKPYKFRKCMIYSPTNRKEIEGFAEMLYRYPIQEKQKMHNNLILLGDTKYLMLMTDKQKIWLVSEERKDGRKIMRVWLKEQ